MQYEYRVNPKEVESVLHKQLVSFGIMGLILR